MNARQKKGLLLRYLPTPVYFFAMKVGQKFTMSVPAGLASEVTKATSEEEGFVTVADTLRVGDAGAPVHQFEAHNNAVFDVRWSADGERLLTASGDQTIREWDAERLERRGVCKGHLGSVKCVATSPVTPHVIASGSRDGSLRLWDLRNHRAVHLVSDVANGGCLARMFTAARALPH